jgi:tetratricopeptide (TPR) repeat protein
MMASTQPQQFSDQVAADAAALFNSAIQLYSARNFEAAEAACRRVLAIVPTHGDALHMLGALHGERGQYAPAADFFRKATDVDSQAVHYWLSLGMALYRLGRLDDAAATLRKAVALRPDMAQAHFGLSVVLKDAGRTAEADQYIRNALVLNPGLIKPDDQTGTALLDFGLYVSYRPDSDIAFKRHPEFGPLLHKWIWNNESNNSGDIARLYSLILNIKQVLADGVPGDIAEVGVYRGNSAAVLAHYARANGRRLYLFDTFKGFDARDLKGVDRNSPGDFSETSLKLVQQHVGEQAVVYVEGYFPQSIPLDIADRFAIAHLDCDLYAPMKAGLAFFYPRLSPGGLLLLHDYSSGYFPGAKQAIDEFVATIPENLVLLPDKSGSALVRKSSAPK